MIRRAIGRIVGRVIGMMVGWAVARAIRQERQKNPFATNEQIMASIFGEEYMREHGTAAIEAAREKRRAWEDRERREVWEDLRKRGAR